MEERDHGVTFQAPGCATSLKSIYLGTCSQNITTRPWVSGCYNLFASLQHTVKHLLDASIRSRVLPYIKNLLALNDWNTSSAVDKSCLPPFRNILTPRPRLCLAHCSPQRWYPVWIPFVPLSCGNTTHSNLRQSSGKRQECLSLISDLQCAYEAARHNPSVHVWQGFSNVWLMEKLWIPYPVVGHCVMML